MEAAPSSFSPPKFSPPLKPQNVLRLAWQPRRVAAWAVPADSRRPNSSEPQCVAPAWAPDLSTQLVRNPSHPATRRFPALGLP